MFPLRYPQRYCLLVTTIPAMKVSEGQVSSAGWLRWQPKSHINQVVYI